MKTIDDAERLLGIIDKLNPIDYKRVEYEQQRDHLAKIESSVGAVTSVLAGLDRIILAHKASEGHREMEQAMEYKEVLTSHKAGLQKQATLLQSLIRSVV